MEAAPLSPTGRQSGFFPEFNPVEARSKLKAIVAATKPLPHLPPSADECSFVGTPKKPAHAPISRELSPPHPSVGVSGEGDSGQLIWSWEIHKNTPYKMLRGTAVGCGSVGYFSPGRNMSGKSLSREMRASFMEDLGKVGDDVYTFDLESYDQPWSELPKCPSTRFGLAVVNNLVTAVGGISLGGRPTNHLNSFSGGEWVKIFPAMPTKRFLPAVITAQNYLIAAGGKEWRGVLSTVEVMDMNSREWYTAASLPEPAYHASATVCGDQLYFLGGKSKNGASRAVFTCSLASLVHSCHPPSQTPTHTSETSVWQRVADVPVVDSTCTTFNERVLAIGEADIHMYNADSDSWPVVGRLPTRHSECLVVVLTDCIVAAGGWALRDNISVRVEVGYLGYSPSISYQSGSQVSVTGESVTLCIEAKGTAPLQYNWLRDGMVVEEAEHPMLEFMEVTEECSGSYQCLVKNQFGQTVSKPLKLEVGNPIISTSPKSQVSFPGKSVTLCVKAKGTAPLHYSWFCDDKVIKGAECAMLTLMEVREADSGSYQCCVENHIGKAESNPAQLLVGDPLLILHPESQIRATGESVTLCTEAKGTVPLHFTWLHDNKVVEGADGPVLTLNGVREADSGSYVCKVENQVGKIVSQPAELQVGDPPAIKLHPERHFSLTEDSVTFSVEAEGTGPLRYSWFCDNQLMDEAEGPVLTLTGVTETQSGNYQCQVENLLGKAVSEPAELYVGRILYSELKFIEVVGKGGFGTVWRGEWIPGKKVVAIKKMEKFEREVEILQSLRHPRIIQFYGLISEPQSMSQYIVTEFAENGSIYDYIHVKKEHPSLEQGLLWAKQVAEGMQYLHQMDYIHRDLKTANVLLTSDLNTKICDLGSARNLEHTAKLTTAVGTYAWMAPETKRAMVANGKTKVLITSLPRKPVSKLCDVYSYGILLWEIVTQQLPFADCTPILVPTKVVQGERPPIPDICEPYVKQLMEQCWQKNAQGRPTFSKILTVLQNKGVKRGQWRGSKKDAAEKKNGPCSLA